MEAHFQLNVITNVLQAVCGCLDAVTAYTHKLDLELWCVFSQEMMPQLKMSCPLPKCSEVGFFRSIFSCHFIFTQCLTIPIYHFPSTSSHTNSEEGFMFFFCTRLIFSPSVWPDLHRTLHHASPHLKSPALRACL